MSVNDYDIELYEAIQDLADKGHLELGTPAYGVAQQVVHLGYESLSAKQRAVYDAVVVPALRRRGAELERLRFENID